LVDQRLPHGQKCARVGQVLQPRDRRLRAQGLARRRHIERHSEHGIVAQAGGVIGILIARRDHHQAETDHVGQGVGDAVGRARIPDAGRKAISNAKSLLDLAQQHQPAIRREHAAIESRVQALAGNG
jgi:hypothetical protein